MESLSIRASRAWGAFGRVLDPLLVAAVGRGIGLNAFAELTDAVLFTGGFGCRPVNFVTDEERDGLVVGLYSWPFNILGGRALRGESGS